MPLQVQAAHGQYSLGTRITSYDNINQLSTSPGKEVSESVKGDLSLSEKTAEVDANLDMSIEAINFEKNQVDDETVYSLFSDFLYSISPNNFEWYVSEIYTQTPIDALVGDVSTNRQYANVFSTGPNYNIRINPVNSLNFQLRAGDYRYEIGDANNKRVSGLAAWPVNISPALVVGLNYELESVFFDSPISYEDYTRRDYYLSVDYTRGYNIYELEYGRLNIDYDNSDSTEDSRYMLAIETVRTSESRVRIELSRSVMDTASLLESQIGSEVQFYRLTTTSSDLFSSRLLRLTYSHDISVGGFVLQLESEESRYERQVEEDFDRAGAVLRVDLHESATSSIAFESRYYNIDRFNTTPVRGIDDYYYSLTYTYNIRRNVAIDFQAIYQERTSLVSEEAFNDTRYSVSLVYTSI